MATDIKRCMKTLILLYQTCAIQPKRDRLHDIVRCIEMLKAIEFVARTSNTSRPIICTPQELMGTKRVIKIGRAHV
jgi:hypothetical protein